MSDNEGEQALVGRLEQTVDFTGDLMGVESSGTPTGMAGGATGEEGA